MGLRPTGTKDLTEYGKQLKNKKTKGAPKVPTETEFNKLTPKQQEARRRAASLNNITLSPEEKAAKKAMENKVKKPMKKMNMGGMTAPMMGDPKSKKPMMPPKRKPAPRPSPIVDPMAKAPDPRMKDPRAKRGAMPMMQEGGAVPAYKAGKKVRGYGMARGGKACKMR